MNYIQLDEKDLLNVLIMIKGIYALAGVDHYAELSEAPKFKTDPEQLYLSHLLNIDYEKEVINNKKLHKLTKSHGDEIKMLNNIFKNKYQLKHLWNNLNDSLCQIICNFVLENEISKKTKNKLDNQLKDYYNQFLSIVGLQEYKTENYELTGYVDEKGNPLYRKIEK